MRRPSGLAALSLEEEEKEEEETPTRPRYAREESFEVSANDTFSAADGLAIRGAKGTEVSLADLERGKLLGRGASGRVYLMRHRRDADRRYALKELQTLADDGARKQVVNEMKIARKHQAHTAHVVKMVDAYFVDGKLSVLMEFCDGGSLEDAFKAARALPTARALPIDAIAAQMLGGLQYMHREMRQVHREHAPHACMHVRIPHVHGARAWHARRCTAT